MVDETVKPSETATAIVTAPAKCACGPRLKSRLEVERWNPYRTQRRRGTSTPAAHVELLPPTRWLLCRAAGCERLRRQAMTVLQHYAVDRDRTVARPSAISDAASTSAAPARDGIAGGLDGGAEHRVCADPSAAVVDRPASSEHHAAGERDEGERGGARRGVRGCPAKKSALTSCRRRGVVNGGCGTARGLEHSGCAHKSALRSVAPGPRTIPSQVPSRTHTPERRCPLANA
jgi:hypothetical protein